MACFFHTGGQSERQKKSVSSADWMSELSDELSLLELRELVVPGTHDSATADLDILRGLLPERALRGPVHLFLNCLSWTRRTIFGWSQTQTLTIHEQLHAGIRYFDLRIAIHPEDGELYACHGCYGASLEKIFSELDNFLMQHPLEVVFVDFNRLYMDDFMKCRLIYRLFQRFGDKMAPSEMGTRIPLRTLQCAHCQLIVFMHASDRICSRQVAEKLWVRGECLDSPWINTPCVRALRSGLKKAVFSHIASGAPKFFVLQAVLTPGPSTVTWGLFWRGSPASLSELTGGLGECVLEWLETGEFDHSNIFIVDYCHRIDFMSAVIRLNRSKADEKKKTAEKKSVCRRGLFL